jgi:hypothetical protein
MSERRVLAWYWPVRPSELHTLIRKREPLDKVAAGEDDVITKLLLFADDNGLFSVSPESLAWR